MPAAIPAHSDDHHGGVAGRFATGDRHRYGIGVAASARNHDHRRIDLQPDADALHHSSGLPVLRPAAAVARTEALRAPPVLPERRAAWFGGVDTEVRRLNRKRMNQMNRPFQRNWAGLALGAFLFSSGCMVGPNYNRPPAPAPPAFKEPPPDGWKEAQPNDAALKGKWWEIYNDPKLNALEEQVSISNQNVLMAEAQYRAARASVQIARSALFPTLTAGPTIGVSQGSGGVSSNQVAAAEGVHTTYQIPFDVSYQVDLWGSIRRNIRANAETPQATEAQLENAKLTYQADLAQDYFQLHGTDSAVALLQSTVDSYTGFLKLTQARHDSGIASGADVAQAETQLDSAKEQLIDLGVARAQYEHAIAILIGKPPAELTIEPQTLKGEPPQVPVAF